MTASPKPRTARQPRAFGRPLAGLVGGFLVGLAVAAAPLPAQAHTELTSSTPAAKERLDEPPSEIVLKFSEEVSARFTTITLAVNGAEPVRLDKRVNGATVTADAPDRPVSGRWTVAYRIGSADGHPVTGSVDFAVAAAVPPPTPSATATTRTTPTPVRTSPAPSTSTSTPPASTPPTEPARTGWWRWLFVGLAAVTLVAAPAAAASRGLGVRPDPRAEAADDSDTSAEPPAAADEPDEPDQPAS